MNDPQTPTRRNPSATALIAAAPVLAVLTAFCLMASGRLAGAATPAWPQRWIATWTASPQAYHTGPEGAMPQLAGRTIRERMRVTVGGDALRVRISNEFGTTPLAIGGATIGTPTGPASVAPGSLKTLTFSGRKSIVVPPGAPVLSDPVKMGVPPGSDVSISIYLPQTRHLPITLHMLGLRTAAISPPGDFTARLRLPEAASTTASVFVTALMVPRTPGQDAIVALGDSITDGNNSTVDALRNWPDDFARRLAAAGLERKIAIVNEAISGNQLRHDFAGVGALARFDRDVLSIPGARYVILLEGINDLGFPGANMLGHLLAPLSAMPSAQDIIGAYRQLIARAHAHGLKIIGATLTPWEGTDLPGYYTALKEPVREAINRWIRSSGEFDGVIDFDAALRDPSDPHRLLPRYASRDHLHPSDAGYQAMADAVSLSLFGS